MNITFKHRLEPALAAAKTLKANVTVSIEPYINEYGNTITVSTTSFTLGRVTLNDKTVTVDVGLLAEAVKLGSLEAYTFSLTDDALVMVNGVTTYRFRIVDDARADNLPPVNLLADYVTADPLDWRKADDKRLVESLMFVSVGAATDVSRPILTQLALTPNGTVASADGYRLHTVTNMEAARAYAVPLQDLRIAEAVAAVKSAQADLSSCIVPPLAFEAVAHKATIDRIKWFESACVDLLEYERAVRQATYSGYANSFIKALADYDTFIATLIQYATDAGVGLDDETRATIKTAHTDHSMTAFNAVRRIEGQAADLLRATLPEGLRNLSKYETDRLLQMLTLFAPDSAEAQWIAAQQAIVYDETLDAQPVSSVDRRPQAWYHNHTVNGRVQRVNLANQYIDAVDVLIKLQTEPVSDTTAYLVTKKQLGKKDRLPLVTGRFPDFTAIIPRAFEHEVIVPAQALKEAAKAVMVYAKDNANSVRLTVDGNTLTLLGRSAERGELTRSIDVSYTGAPFEIAVNGQYLLDVASAIPADVKEKTQARTRRVTQKGITRTVTLKVYSPQNPLVLTYQYDDETEWLAVIMPMSTR